VDFIPRENGWFAYVADVSGHGVPAGVLMTMVKSAARTRLASTGPADFTSAINDVLGPLSAPNMYLTLAFLNYANREIEFLTAGHPPILHYKKNCGCVSEHSVSNFPIALLPNVPFQTSKIVVNQGDLLVILTDGLTEIADASERELGLEPLKSVLIENAGLELREIAGRMRQRALAHGMQVDDQTLLLLRARADATQNV
jgi:serine phosphatase RsbU (regulator of sigma subunit)